jgi:branched-chain amino acid transport system permease protein
VFYRRSSFGLATRAAAEDEAMAMRNGLSPDRLSMANTVLASVLAGGLGILFAPEAQLDSTTLALTIIPALAAALLARFSSFGLAALFGFGMGIVESLLVWLQSKPWFPQADGIALPGVSDVVFFVVIGVVLFTRGQVLPERGSVAEKRLPAAPPAQRLAVPAAAIAAVVALALVALPFGYRQALINTEIGTVMCLSLVVITGFLGQVSLLQFGLAGATALVMTKLSASSGIGFPFAPMIGVALAVAVGLLTALPTLRVRGVSLAIITMAGAVAIENFWLGNVSFGFNPLSGNVTPPTLLGVDLGPNAAFGLGPGGRPSPVFGFLCLVAAVGSALLVAALRRSELGQRMLAIRSNERAAAAAGVSVRETKLVAYGIASLLAGIGGALYAYSFQAASASSFGISVALGFVAFAYMGGITTVTGAIVGGVLCTGALATHTLESVTGISPDVELVVAGLLLILTVTQYPDGIAGGLRRSAMRRRRLGTRPAAGPAVAGTEPSAP